MPILKTGGIKTGELRFFEVRRRKIKRSYKIICHFCRIRWILGKNRLKKHNNYRYLKLSPGMAFANKYINLFEMLLVEGLQELIGLKFSLCKLRGQRDSITRK